MLSYAAGLVPGKVTHENLVFGYNRSFPSAASQASGLYSRLLHEGIVN